MEICTATRAPPRWLRAKSARYFRKLLHIRDSSKLFRLRDQQSVIENVSFPNTGPTQIPGLIAMWLKADHRHWGPELAVLFDGSNQSIEFSHEESCDNNYWLHPSQRGSIDWRTRQSKFRNGEFRVPAMTTAVLLALNNGFVTSDN